MPHSTTGFVNPNSEIEAFGLTTSGQVHYNLVEAQLYEEALRRGEAHAVAGGALVATTGQHTGRSPQDKFVVRSETTENTIWWDNNKSMDSGKFALLYEDFKAHLSDKDLFVQDLLGGADPASQIKVRVIAEFAWHNLFIRHLLRRPDIAALKTYVPEFTIIDLPSFKADAAKYGVRSETVIALDLDRKLILIGGTAYAGEMKKSVFTVLNYLLPEQNIMPMHCSANVSSEGDTTLFFGLSGTGKTTLSADPKRVLIGDDEHGWGEDGVFNFEGGCYAKMIRLSSEAEPDIYNAVHRFGSVLENVVIDPYTCKPDFNDGSLTENTRGAYPIDYIANASASGRAGHPTNLVMLTADAFGVLPPIAKLTPQQAMYHFLSGYTAKVAGTERGVTEPQATFSTCFGAPFMPRHPAVYGELLKDQIARHDVTCWLVNTGWTSGAYGTGYRMPIKATRALLNAALDGSLDKVEYRNDQFFGFAVPVSAPGVDPKLLNPRETWEDKAAYDQQAAKLVGMFIENFAQFEAHVDTDVKASAPQV